MLKKSSESAGAQLARCTDTAGYLSNYEIRDIISHGSGFKTQHSDDEDDILVYNSMQWVSYMKRETDAGPGQGDQGSGPVYVLASPTTISFPPVTVTFLDTWSTAVTVSGVVVTTAASSVTSTVLTPPPLTTQAIPVSNVVWSPSMPVGAPPGTTTTSTTVGGIIWLTNSIIPPPVTVAQTHTRYPAAASGPTTPARTPRRPTHGPASTAPSNTPSGAPRFPPTVKVQPGSPSPTCRPLQNCGLPCVVSCTRWSIPCLGVRGCIGPLCPQSCVGPLCPGSDGGGCTDPGPNPDPNPGTCRRPQTASLCKVDCTVMRYPASATTRCKDPECTRTFTICTATGSTTATTNTYSCPAYTAYDRGNLSDKAQWIGDGGDAGYIADYGNFVIQPETVTVSSVVAVPVPVATSTSTRVIVVEPDTYAECAFWDYLFFWHLNIYNIISNNGWFDRAETELRGSGALTGWEAQPRAGNTYARLWFNLPFWIKEGCMERALVSAGGPKIS
ncbi:hypothetical protein C8A05DRAFT_36365 [Staphylotrichum tortipilum]|uniref:Uncharacterized protein n=1 Tax=Staphylotrichum tortipilum TaxID=2831512 RepID=A0AAN6MFN6_9PEZI|nr:hypothetical protein C8A05DRAFT_36365 [Staphylotrichum longicolle]